MPSNAPRSQPTPALSSLLRLVLVLIIFLTSSGSTSYQPPQYTIPAPYNVSATTGDPYRIRISWEADGHFALDHFDIISPGEGGITSLIAEVPYSGSGSYWYDLTLDDINYFAYQDYDLAVKACPENGYQCDSVSGTVTGNGIIARPHISATNGIYDNKVEITFTDWIPDSYRTYKVYRSTTSAGTYQYLGEIASIPGYGDENLFVDSTVSTGTTYHYKGKICNYDIRFIPAVENCSEFTLNPVQGYASGTPAGIRASDGTGPAIDITWDAYDNASFYQLYQTNTSTPPDPTTEYPLKSDINSTSYAAEGMTPYKNFYYWVRAYDTSLEGYTELSDPDSGWRTYELSVNVFASNGTSADAVNVTWDNDDDSHIDFYQIYRGESVDGSRSVIGTSTILSYADSNAVPGDTYYYWVQSCDYNLRCSGLAGPDAGFRSAGDPPTISMIDDQFILEDTSTGPLTFIVGDTETDPSVLEVTGVSSNTTLLPETNIVLGGSGENRTVTLNPAADQSGSTIVTLTVSDPYQSTQISFSLTVSPVNDPPTDLTLSSNTIAENQPAGIPIGFFTPTDPDPDDFHVYGFDTGDGDAGNDSFFLGGNHLFSAVDLDYETQQQYSIRVFTQDSGGAVYSESFLINIEDVDDTPPVVTSIVREDSNPTSASVVNYTVTFSESVFGVDTIDFSLTTSGLTGTGVSSVSGSGSTYSVTVFAVTGSGSLRLDFQDNDSVQDLAMNPVGGFGLNNGDYSSGEVYTLDREPPAVSSITRVGADPTNASSVEYTVTFTETVSGVDTSDFNLTTSGLSGTSITSVSGADASYTVTVNTGTGSGTLRLDLSDDDTIIDELGIPLGGNGVGNGDYAAGEAYTLDRELPAVSSITRVGADPTNASSVEYTVTFTETVSGVDTSDFSLTTSGLTGTSVTSVSGADASYTVTVNTGTGSGTLRLDLIDDDTIGDEIDNLLGGTGAGNGDFTSGESYHLDRQSPIMAATTPADLEVLTTGPTELVISFSKDVLHDGSSQAVDYPGNYLLFQAGPNGIFDTPSCADYPGGSGDDDFYAVGPITYENNAGVGPYQAVLTVNGGVSLPAGEYRLHICGSTSIEDLVGNTINGGMDQTITFTIQRVSLPATGFTPGRVTLLAPQTAQDAYQTSKDLLLEIPALGLREKIVGVPLIEDGWNLTWLEGYVGWLNGTAYPTWTGNTVLTAHAYRASGLTGPFSELDQLRWGDTFTISAHGQRYTYQVRELDYARPDQTWPLFSHEDYDWVTLITCRHYDEALDGYRWRTIVRAILTTVEPLD